MSNLVDRNKLYEVTPEGWGDEHKAAWLKEQAIKRSYHDEVVNQI